MSEEPFTLSGVAAKAIAELRTKHKVEPTVNEIVWLHALGQRVENPAGAPHAGLAGAPVRVGNVVLWPLSMGASRWFLEVGEPLLGKSSIAELVLAYAMVHSRRPEILWQHVAPETLREAVKDWHRTIGVRPAELRAGILCVQGREPIRPIPADEDEDDAPTPAQMDRNLRVILADLCEHYPATTPEYWTWGKSMTETLDCLYAVRAQRKAKGEAPDLNEPSNAAFVCFRQAVAAIIEAHKAKASLDGQ